MSTKSRALFTLATVADLLNLDTRAVAELIDDGKLPFAFNISASNKRRRDIRILAESFHAYREAKACPVKTLADAVKLILPLPGALSKGPDKIRASALARHLGCKVDHVMHLVKAGDLKMAVKLPFPQSPMIDHESAVQFLHRRCLGVAAYKYRVAL